MTYNVFSGKLNPAHFTSLLEYLHWLPIEHRIIIEIASTAFRTLHSCQSAYLYPALHAHHSTHSLRLSNTNLQLQLQRSQIYVRPKANIYLTICRTEPNKED